MSIETKPGNIRAALFIAPEIVTDAAPDPHAPMGARGIGEIGITGTSAAIANAIYNACGVRVRDLPITLDKLAEA